MEQALINAFLDHLRTRDCSPYTVDGYRRDLETFFTWLREQTGRDIPPAEVTPFDVQRYRDALVDAGYKPSTVNRRISSLRAFFAWANQAGNITNDPTHGVKLIRQARRVPRALTKQEVYLLQRTAAARRQLTEARANGEITPAVVTARRDEAILNLLLYTGIRVGELVALRVADVELSERKGKVIVRSGKGRKYREVPLHLEARKALRAYLEVRPNGEDDHLFLGQRGPLTARGVQFRLEEIGREAGVRVTPHVLRHTFATRLLREAGVDLVTTATLLGHESVSTTAIYTQPNEADLEEAVGKLV